MKSMSITAADKAQIAAVHRNQAHEFSKITVPAIELVAGRGVKNDAHFGVTVKHRSRVARDPTQPNLRQVHLLQEELFAALADSDLNVCPGDMGENLTTRGIDLLALGTGTRLRNGLDAVVEITGLRNPCAQIESFQPGLLAAVLSRSPNGTLIRKAGVMAIVVHGGFVKPNDAIEIECRPAHHKALMPV